MLKESIEYHRQGRLDDAEQGYRARLADQPDDVDALHLLGLLRHQRGDTNEGALLLERAETLAPEDASIIATRATLEFREGRHDAALTGYERALSFDPNLGGAHSGIGQIALLRGENQLAEQHFRIALRAGEDAQALAGLGLLLLERDDIDGALRHLGRASDLAPDDAMTQLSLGRAFSRKGTLSFAERAFENALRLKPDFDKVRLLLGDLLMRDKRPREAEVQLRSVLANPEHWASAQIALGDAARADGRLDEAAEAYRAVVVRDPNCAIAVRALAWSLALAGRKDEAIAVYDGYLARVGDELDMRIARADLLTMLGRTAGLDEEWAALRAMAPDNPLPHRRLAQISEQRSDWRTANEAADAALRVAPNSPDMLLLRCRAALRDADFEHARELLDALGRSPLTALQQRLRSHYAGHLHDQTGEFIAAVGAFAQAQADFDSNLPPLADPHPEFIAALDEPVGEPWPQAPVLLLGTPGSGVERVAALLADQPQLTVLRDRVGATVRADDFSAPRFALYAGPLDAAERADLRERYLAPLRAAGVAIDRPLVDFLPRWDVHLLALLRRAMPGTRLIIVDADPRDALLNWLAFGWAPGFACADPVAAAKWLRRARAHLEFGADFDQPRRIVVGSDALRGNDAGAVAALARFLGLETLRQGAQTDAAERGLGDLPTHFLPSHWRAYGEALGDAFRQLD